jgi:hypothetical protein
MENTSQYIQKFMNTMVEGEMLEVKVARLDDDGKEYETLLKAPIQKVKSLTPPELAIDDKASTVPVALRNAWLGTN